jgi:hypothetical protein
MNFSRRPALQRWISTVTQHMPHLSKSQATVLALWSFGMVITQSCGLPTVSAFIALLLCKKENTVRQQLREWYWDADAKKGQHRQELNVALCFAPLVRWILSLWPATQKRLALALDATCLKDCFVVLTISIVYRGCAIPVAWTVLPANTKGAWKDHWLNLLQVLHAGIPSDWFVLVMADRGLYAKWLYGEIVRNGWHPFLRINKDGTYRPQGKSNFRPLVFASPRVGACWTGHVTCFRKHPLDCTLLTRWDEPHSEPWLIVTDLHPEQADVCWYAMRAWIEAGFKDTKRGGWRWNNTRITDPKRSERHWLAIAVATLWAVSVGGEADATLPESSIDELPELHIAKTKKTKKHSRPRLISCFRRGVIVILVRLIAGQQLRLGRFYPEPWPTSGVATNSG